MKIIITGDIAFPQGGAALARVMHIADACCEMGMKVHVVALSGAEHGAEFGVPRQVTCGARGVSVFAWISGAPSHRPSRLRWLWNTYSKTTVALRWYLERHPLHSSDVVYVYGRSYLRLRRLISFAKRCGAFTVLDVTEGIERFSGFGGRVSPVFWDLALGTRFLPREVGLVASISRGLARRARQFGAQNITLLPAVEDWRGAVPYWECGGGKTARILVFGALFPKDDPALLLRVIMELARRRVPVSLELVGRYAESPVRHGWAERIAACSNDVTQVRLHGAPKAEELSSVLSLADGFLMLRPNSVAEQLAFPTRLVELLQVGRPILVSDVGDVSCYLSDREHALLLPPGDAVAAADKLEELLRLPDRGRAIGLRGWEQGRRCFNRETLVRSLLAEIDKVRKQTTR